MKNYYQIKLWHEKVEKKDAKEESALSGDEMDSDEILFNKTYVKQKLELGLNRIWQVIHCICKYVSKYKFCLTGCTTKGEAIFSGYRHGTFCI